MEPKKSIIILCLLVCLSTGCAFTVEETKYRLVSKTNSFELRDYPAYIVAETFVDGSLEEAGNKAFKKLFNYISGENRSQEKVAMTAPVNQKPVSEKIAMTTPVGQKKRADGWMVSFTMPGSYTLDSLPVPKNPDVTIREIPARRMACVRYSGTWSEKRYRHYLQKLETWIKAKDLNALDEPIWARYNPPVTPWFLRRNEILIQVGVKEKQ